MSKGEYQLLLNSEEYINNMCERLEILSEKDEKVPTTTSCDVTDNGTKLESATLYQN